MCYYILRTTKVRDYLEDIDVLAIMIGSLGHDIDHPGVNNIYLHMSRRGNWRFRRNPQYKLYLYLDPGKLFFCTFRQDLDYPLF